MNADSKLPLIDLEADNNATGRKQLELQRERLSEGDYMYCVYWIKSKAHSCIETQGYVGITKNLAERIRAHKKNRKKTPFTDAIRSYGWDNLEVILLGDSYSLEQALLIEALYRPFQNIGWNLQRGGELGVESSWYSIESNQTKHKNATANATRKWIAEKDSTEARSSRAKSSWLNASQERRELAKGSKNPRAKLTEQDVAKIKYEMFPQGMSNSEIAAVFGVQHYVISFIRTGKNWSYI